jgi:hypothetical protein
VQREYFELGCKQVPENTGLRSSAPSRNSTEDRRKIAHRRTRWPDGPSTRSRAHRQNNAVTGPNEGRQSNGEISSLETLAEREGFELAVRIHWGRLTRREVSPAGSGAVKLSELVLQLPVATWQNEANSGFCWDNVIATEARRGVALKHQRLFWRPDIPYANSTCTGSGRSACSLSSWTR